MTITTEIPPDVANRHARLTRLRHIAARLGYVADGNHLFTAVDHANIYLGRWRASVLERPHAFPASIVRLARCLARFYT